MEICINSNDRNYNRLTTAIVSVERPNRESVLYVFMDFLSVRPEKHISWETTSDASEIGLKHHIEKQDNDDYSKLDIRSPQQLVGASNCITYIAKLIA